MSKKYNYDSFISKVTDVHRNQYDYSLVEFIDSYTKVKIICPIHGIFEQKPVYHINGKECHFCGIEKSIKNRTNNLDFYKKKYNSKFPNDNIKILYRKEDYIYFETEFGICKKKLLHLVSLVMIFVLL